MTEIAKIHIRYMVGGRTEKVSSERWSALNFRSVPAHCPASEPYARRMEYYFCSIIAIMVRTTAVFWSVSMYLESDNEAFADFLESLGYVYKETDNPAYKLFLA